MKYLALLRGINVSGKNSIKMEDLRKLLEINGLNNVKTYIQSGNVFFESDENTNFSKKISSIIKTHYGFDISVIMVAKSDLEFVINTNPFYDKNLETKQLYVSFLSEKPSNENFNLLKEIDFNGDLFEIKERFLFLKYADSAANTKLDNKIIEKKLQVIATTRNWNTVNKLLAMYNL